MATKMETATEAQKTQTCKVQSGQKAELSASASCDRETSVDCPEQVCCEKVREQAYYKWEQAGYPSGDGVNFWLEAEAEVQALTETE
jgi:hypothetical protein